MGSVSHVNACNELIMVMFLVCVCVCVCVCVGVLVGGCACEWVRGWACAGGWGVGVCVKACNGLIYVTRFAKTCLYALKQLLRYS